MYLSWIDYTVFVLLLIFSCGIGIYQGCIRSKQTSTKEFLLANGRMKILPTAMSLLASLTSAASLLGMPVEFYYFGSMLVYCVVPWFIGTYLTMKFFIPKFHYVGNASIYAYLEQRFSLTIRILVTGSFILVTILSMATILYGPSIALSQVTGLNIWLSVGLCGIVCTVYTSIGGMKAVIWTDVIQASIMFIGLTLSIIFGFIDLGGVSKVFEIVNNGNRLQFADIRLDLSIRYTFWSIFIGVIFSSTAQYACIQTQAQRYMCVKDTKTAQRVAWTNYVMFLTIKMLCLCVGCLLYAKYSQCDPIRSKKISRPDQMYPLFVIETLGRFPGLTGLFIACILSATLSTFSSGVNSTATVVLEDIYKRLTKKELITNDRQVLLSKILSVCIGSLTVLMAFLVSFMQSNIITIIIQIFGVFAAPILGIYILGFFFSRVKSRSVCVAFFICLIFQLFLLFGSIFMPMPPNKNGGRLPTSVDQCIPAVNETASTTTTEMKSNGLVALFSISPLWFICIGTLITIVVGLILSFILDYNDPKVIDPLLLVSPKDILPCVSSRKVLVESSTVDKTDRIIEEDMML
ncbi:unnamed protein product [Adineta ricciae]|uniref:Uncharacterized protein n=2 Tax=Adineta ricciae TaxID=249248 RepID=A0A815M9D6_ADIRI|nr:unnamed protein product [Adineta ricciae]